ncbi:hypothetical protein [Natrinema versiforme]|uniref:Uncharacterized protein n=1 Tax=Natrinema versiforme TaxID=88724 RepID=A0A4P8WMU1_9EURY|nr:hypothetical protein [Natrinema versiforme]QCS44754.1 hypothetical protein FEJ81_21005 [Natrinema versiforme]QCS45000.1 hypothetical protein FEJ81_22285 [Natrinema versiforme]
MVPSFTMSTGALLAMLGLGVFAALILSVMSYTAQRFTEYYVCEECGDDVSEFEATNNPDPEGGGEVWYCTDCSAKIDT